MELEKKYIAPGAALLDGIWERRTFGDWTVADRETVDVVDHYYDLPGRDEVGRLAAAGALFRLRLSRGRVVAALKLRTADERVRHEHEVEPDPALWPDLFVTGDGWNAAVIRPSRPPCPTLEPEVVAALARALGPSRPGVSLLGGGGGLAHTLTVVNRRRVLSVVHGGVRADISLDDLCYLRPPLEATPRDASRGLWRAALARPEWQVEVEVTSGDLDDLMALSSLVEEDWSGLQSCAESKYERGLRLTRG